MPQSRRKLMRQIQRQASATWPGRPPTTWPSRAGRRAEFTAMITDLREQVRRQAGQTRGQFAELSADLRRGGEVFGVRGRNPRFASASALSR